MIYKVHYFSCLPFPFSAFASFRLKRSNPYFWILTLTLAALSNPKQISAQQNNVSFQVFYDALSPYGQWVDYQNYGYVWIPDVSPEFAPYSSDGYWILTDYGWTWVSDYEWGWAPFHYGRWDYDNYYGWLWVPDNEWGPSWVNWRMADGYYGGSPMEPGISITLSFGRPYNSYNDHWNFVRAGDFESRDIYRYFVDRSNHSRIIRNSTVINTTYIDNSRHTTYVTGPAREDVQRVTGRRISPVAIQENSRPGKDQNDGRLKMYRPQVIKNSQLERKPAPERVDNLNNVKRPSERKSATQPREINQKNNNDARPAQPRSVAPVDNKQQQQNSRQQQNDNRYQPGQKSQQAVSPTNNQRQQQQNNNIQQENKTRTQPSQEPQHVALVKNNEKLQQDNNFRQQDNTAQPAQQQQQQHQKQQQQPQQRTTPANTNQERQQIIQKQNNQQIREQAKEKKSEDEKKPNN